MPLDFPGHDSELEISGALRAFAEEFPHERWPIVRFVIAAAREIAPGSRVADVGAGSAPYRELFGHVDYTTVDWANSPHGSDFDIVARADAVPEPDGAFDAVLLTQVLEHTFEPAAVLREMRRLLRPGGRLYLTVPFAWELHELPYDFYRYAQPALERLLGDADFEEVDVRPRNDVFTTLAQLLLNARWAMGHPSDGLERLRGEAIEMLESLAGSVAALAPLDSQRIMPLGYCATATRPDG